MATEDPPFVIPESIEVTIDGVLDLHLFSPKDLGTLVPDYLAECHKRGILQVRFIHGRGTGSIMRSVHALLSRSPLVKAFRLGGPNDGGAGATLVDLLAEPAVR